jgi:hypothetical protein
MYWQRIPAPMQLKLPHGWHLSNTSYAVPPPPPVGPEKRTLIVERRAHMSPDDRSQPTNAHNIPACPGCFQGEHDIEIARLTGCDAGHFNRVGRRAW